MSNDENEGLEDGAIYYTNSTLAQSDTYWQQIIDKFDMNLCVNNSWSGAFLTQHAPYSNADKDADGSISSGVARADDLAKNDGTQPDYIIVFMGTNDLGAGVSSTTFASAYNQVLDMINQTYPNAKVFCINLPNRDTTNPVAYNNAISSAVNSHENTYLVDLYNSEFTGNVYKSGMIDNVHPNAIGMDYMTDIIIEAMKDALLSD